MFAGGPFSAAPFASIWRLSSPVAFTAVVAGGGSAQAGVAKAAGFVVAAVGGGAASAGLVKSVAFGVSVDGGGAAQLGLVKSVAITVASAGGGAVVVNFQAIKINLFAVPLPGSRIVDSRAVPRVTIKPVRIIS